MGSPMEKFVEWFMSLPVAHREHIAIAMALDNNWIDDLSDETKKWPKYFIDKINAIDNEPAQIGFVLAIRAQIDFMFYHKEATKERSAVISAEFKNKLAERGKGHLLD